MSARLADGGAADMCFLGRTCPSALMLGLSLGQTGEVSVPAGAPEGSA